MVCLSALHGGAYLTGLEATGNRLAFSVIFRSFIEKAVGNP
jgi:hypothetical protein